MPYPVHVKEFRYIGRNRQVGRDTLNRRRIAAELSLDGDGEISFVSIRDDRRENSPRVLIAFGSRMDLLRNDLRKQRGMLTILYDTRAGIPALRHNRAEVNCNCN